MADHHSKAFILLRNTFPPSVSIFSFREKDDGKVITAVEAAVEKTKNNIILAASLKETI